MFEIIHAEGWGEVDPPLSSLPALLDELQDADREHGDVGLIHQESMWCVSAHRDGRLILERLGSAERLHMTGASKEVTLEVWRELAAGDIDAVLSRPWQPGYA